MSAEPELEDLSAYADQVLTGAARQQLEAHLATCETCRRRLEALRQTVSAIKALPMEAPPRVFTIPPQREQRSARAGWAWAGGALAAACLVLVVTVGLTHIPRTGGGAATAPGLALFSQGRGPNRAATGFKSMTVTDPQNASRQLTLNAGTPSASADQAGTSQGYLPAPNVPQNGSIQVGLRLAGVPGDTVPTSLSDARLRVSLSRPGYEVVLNNPDSFSATRDGATVSISATYRLASLGLPNPAAGNYTLRATWQGPDTSAVTLVAEVPITISG